MAKLHQSLTLACYGIAAVVLVKLAAYVTPGVRLSHGVVTLALCGVCLAAMRRLLR